MKKVFFMLLAVAALTGCSESETVPVGGDDAVQIRLRSTTADASGVDTRAPFEGAIGASNVLEARVITSSLADFTGTPYANGIMNFKGGVATNYETTDFAGTSTFPASPTVSLYLFGLYPKGWAYTTNGAAEFTFTGKEDAMATGSVTTKKQDAIDGSYQILSFRHLLTRLEVKLSASAPVIPTLGAISTIKLVGSASASPAPVRNKVTVNNSSTMTIDFPTGSTTPSMDFYDLSLDANSKKVYSNNAVSAYTLTPVPAFVGYSMVAPVTATAAVEEYFLEINTTTAGVKRIAVDLTNSAGTPFVGSTAGRSFIVSIYFKSNSDIAVDVQVTPWEEEGEWQGEVAVN